MFFGNNDGNNYDVSFATPQEKRAYRSCFLIIAVLVLIIGGVIYFWKYYGAGQ